MLKRWFAWVDLPMWAVITVLLEWAAYDKGTWVAWLAVNGLAFVVFPLLARYAQWTFTTIRNDLEKRNDE